jgi:TPR repeat protein
MLGTLYADGKIVAQDFVKAAKWFDLATSRGFTMVGTNKRNLLRRMSRAQILEAQRLARLWKPTK